VKVSSNGDNKLVAEDMTMPVSVVAVSMLILSSWAVEDVSESKTLVARGKKLVEKDDRLPASVVVVWTLGSKSDTGEVVIELKETPIGDRTLLESAATV